MTHQTRILQLALEIIKSINVMENTHYSSDSEDDMPLAQLNTMDKQDSHVVSTVEEETGANNSSNGADLQWDDLSDMIPLAELVGEQSGSAILQQDAETGASSDSNDGDVPWEELSDPGDPEYNPGSCEVKGCKKEVWIACPECEILLCYAHSEEEISSCDQHGKLLRKRSKCLQSNENEKNSLQEKVVQPTEMDIQQIDSPSIPEQFTVEGSEKEVTREKRERLHKQKEAKRKGNKGLDYVSVKTNRLVKAREMKPRCSSGKCGRGCSDVTNEQREDIFQSYWNLGDLRLQREFVVRRVHSGETKRSRDPTKESRRKQKLKYFFTVGQRDVPVCKIFFHNTLGVSEQTTKTALKKVTGAGVLEPEKRGGKVSDLVKTRDQMIHKAILDHLSLFPKVESHFCRSSSTREYLHPDLTKRKMYTMFLEKWIPRTNPPSFSLYKKLFKEMNQSIHKPKKDQCSLCLIYREGNKIHQANLQERYGKHVAEKERVRQLKDVCKKAAQEDKTTVTACFDLQQVISLPASNENALFYKRRLANYNLTIYDLADQNCHCFFWSETDSKRGASEIATVVNMRLKMYNNNGIKSAMLFADGCGGQNKNSIMPAMMLHTVLNSVNLSEISVRFFESFHGQNEGDSVHSAIHTAVQATGNLFQPSQLVPVFSLARPKHPYIVHHLKLDDFLDFKAFSKDLRILEARKDSSGEEMVPWNSITELRVFKNHPSAIFYKTSHLHNEFKMISLKRLKRDVKDFKLKSLNMEENKISREKHQDLVLCALVPHL